MCLPEEAMLETVVTAALLGAYVLLLSLDSVAPARRSYPTIRSRSSASSSTPT
ncbi:MAG: hypothetical protein ACOC97_01290 [Myxococcota bacterium]